MTDQDVKVGLTIQEDGDPAAFSAAAQGVSGLATAAGEAEPSLASLADGLTALAASAQGTEAAKQAVADFSQGLKDLGSAQSVDEQRASVDKMLEAWRRLGSEVPDVLDKSKTAAKDYNTTLTKLEEEQRKLSEPLAESLDKAQTAFAKLQNGVENSLSTAGKKLAEARQRIDDYKKAIEDAKAAGNNISAGQLAELQRLEAGYKSASQAVAKYTATKKDVARQLESDRAAASNEVKSITSIRDVVSEAIPTWGKYAGAVAAVIGAYEAGYAAGTKLHDLLQLLSGGTFDKNVQGFLHMQAAADAYVEALNGVAGAEELANQRRIFMQKGLQGFSTDVEKNRVVLDKLAKGEADLRGRHQDLIDATHKLAEAHNVDTAALEKQSKALEREILEFAAQNKQLTSLQIGKIFKDDLQKVLDGYALLGKQAPENLKLLAAQWNVTTSAVEKHKAAVDKVLEGITGLARKSSVELAESAKVLQDAFSHINIGKLNFDELTRARAQVQLLIDEYTKAGQAIPASLAKIAQEVGAFQNAAALMGAKVNDARVFVDGYGKSIGQAGAATQTAAGQIEAGAQSVAKLGDAATKTSGATLKLEHDAEGHVAITSFGEASKGAATGVEHLGEVVTRTTQTFDAAGNEIDRTTRKVVTVGTSVADAGTKVAGAGEVLHKSTQIFDAAGNEIDAAGKIIKQGSEAATKGTLDLSHASNDLVVGTNKIREGLQGVSSEALALNQSFARVKFDASGPVSEIERIGNALDAQEVKVRTFIRQLSGVAGELKGLFAPLLSDLDQVTEKANQAASAVASVGGKH